MSSAADDHRQHGQMKHSMGRELVRYDQRLTVRMIADEVNMNQETVHLIPNDELGMRKICAHTVPRNLTTVGCVVERSF